MRTRMQMYQWSGSWVNEIFHVTLVIKAMDQSLLMRNHESYN